MANFTLAQTGSSASSVLLWVLILIVLLVAGGFVIMHLRRRLLGHHDSFGSSSSELLEHIRQLKESGEIGEDEFTRARTSILGQVQDDLDAKREANRDAKGGPSAQEGADGLG
ncbi:MAG: LPXTG cell wall anchor domain-containing protein [Phycisphaerales bacterium]